MVYRADVHDALFRLDSANFARCDDVVRAVEVDRENRASRRTRLPIAFRANGWRFREEICLSHFLARLQWFECGQEFLIGSLLPAHTSEPTILA